MSRPWKIALALVLLLACGVGWFVFQLFGPSPPIVVSEETTYITEPLADDGLPDYAGYLLAKGREGVTVENNAAVPLLAEKFMPKIKTDVIGKGLSDANNEVDNIELIQANQAIRNHPIEWIGEELRGYMTDMKRLVEA